MTNEMPKTCPPVLAAFIEKMGTKVNAYKALRSNKTMINLVVKGARPMPSDWPILIEKLAVQKEASSSGPVFVAWDGATRSVLLPKRGTVKARTIKNVPVPVADLLEKHKFNASAAARVLGTAGNTFMAMVDGATEFNDRRQRMVFEAMHGVSSRTVDDEGPDKFALDMAIVLVNSKNYPRVEDVAELLNGLVLFRMSTQVGWLVIYRIKGEDARKFKRIASRDCIKIACP